MRQVKRFLLTLILAAVCLRPAAHASELSVCDLNSPKPYLGRLVQVSARVVFTMHGIFLVSDSCKHSSEDVPVLFPKRAHSPEVDFDIDPQAVELMKPFFKPTGGTSTACAVITGRIFYKERFRSREEGAGPQGNGFGPRGAFRFAFVIRSVSEIHPCKRSPAAR